MEQTAEQAAPRSRVLYLDTNDTVEEIGAGESHAFDFRGP